MRAVVMHEPGNVTLEDMPMPSILEPTDAIIKLAATCICGSDLWPYRGAQPVHEQRMGHEYVGTVVKAGEAVTTVKPGDFVVGSFCISCGECEICRSGYPSRCTTAASQGDAFVGMRAGGTQAEYARVALADGTLVKTPEPPTPEQLPSLLAASDVLGTGWFAADEAGAAPGKTIVVVGDGAVGLGAVIAAKQLGASRIIAMSRHADRQALARAFGATDIVEERGEEGIARIKEMTGGLGADGVVEAVGNEASFDQALGCVRPGGHLSFVGVPHGVSLNMDRMFGAEVHMFGGPAAVRKYLPTMIDLIYRGEINPGAVFDLVLPLEQAAEGYAAMDERRATKVMLTLESPASSTFSALSSVKTGHYTCFMRSSLTPSPRDEHVAAPCVPGVKDDPCAESLNTIDGRPESTTHSHGHDHSHGHAASRKRLAIALAITATVFIAELVAAFFTSSLSLAADAGHMAVDSAGLVIAFFAATLALRPRDNRRTWGWARSEVLAATFQAGMLVIISLLVAIEGIQRLVSPVEVHAAPMLWVGVLGLVANALSLMVLIGGSHASLNMRAAVLEVANDALGSFAVIIAAIVELIGGWNRADAVASIFIALLMAPRACMLLLRTLRILMEEVPEEIDLAQVRQHMLSIPLVEEVHDLHVSSVASNLVTVTAHIEVAEAVTASQRDQIIHSLNECAMHHFPVEIAHSTFQVESISHAQHEHLQH